MLSTLLITALLTVPPSELKGGTLETHYAGRNRQPTRAELAAVRRESDEIRRQKARDRILHPDFTDEQRAGLRFQLAESFAADGKRAEAIRTHKLLAKIYPTTKAARASQAWLDEYDD